MVLDATYGSGDEIGGSPVFQNVDDVKIAFTNVNDGDRVTCATRVTTYGDQHAFIVVSITDSGVTIYDCNRVGPNKIGYQFRSWNNLFSDYTKMKGGIHHR